jgi:hypothetical protein
MKLQSRKITTIPVILMFLLLLGFGGCQKDEFTTEPSNQKPYFSTQKIDYNTVIGTFKDPNLVDFLKNQESKMRFEDASKSKNTLFFNKISKGNLYDSYTLQINNFSKEAPYFKFFVLTKKGAQEKAGFVKYIPAKLNPFLDVKHFTGVVEMYDINNNLYATTGFKNGIPNTQEKSNLQAKNCVNLIRIIEHKCSNGGDHAPGEYCDAGLINDAYYEVRVTVLCDPKVSYTAPPDYFITNPVGGGGTGSDYIPQSISAFLDILNDQQKEIATNYVVLNDYLIQNNFSEESVNFAVKFINLCVEQPIFLDPNVPKLFFNLLNATDHLKKEVDENFFAANIDFFNQDVQDEAAINPDWLIQMAQAYLIERAVIKYNHPNWSEFEIYYQALWNVRHTALDAFGLIPVVGEVADLANGVLYTIEGDLVNASLSYASTIPIYGWVATGTKYAMKSVSTVGTKVLLTWKVLADGTVYFGANSTCRAQLRKVLGLAKGSLMQAHHIIPLNLQTNPIIQKAAKAAEAFHMNEALNGIPLSTAVHNGSHLEYDKIIKRYLDAVPTNATPKECYDAVETIINRVRIAIANNPNTPINQLIF